MLNTSKKGSVAVEVVCALLFLLGFAIVIQRFSKLAARTHDLSIDLQNQVEEKMIDAGRPPCLLEEFGERFVRGEISPAIFGRGKVEKGLVFVTRPICSGDEI